MYKFFPNRSLIFICSFFFNFIIFNLFWKLFQSSSGITEGIFLFLKILFFLFSPQSPPVYSCIFFVVGPSNCGTRDAAPAWFDEQCHVRAQDSNQRNTGPPAAERTNSTTWPRGQPLKAISKFKIYLERMHFINFLPCLSLWITCCDVFHLCVYLYLFMKSKTTSEHGKVHY